MRNPAKVAGVLAALALTGGIAAAQAAPAPSAAPAAVSAVPTHTGNIVCAKNNTRELTIFDKTCPSGTHFWAQVPAQDVAGLAGVGVPGPAGPAGPKGDAGDSSVVVKRASLVVNASTGFPKTITIAGLPAKSASVPEIVGNNTTDLPATFGAALTATPVAAANGATERQFTVTGSGFDGTESFTLNVWVLAVP